MLQWIFLTMSLFLPPTDLLLNQKSDEICPCDISSEETQKDIDLMFDVVTENKGVGLAAPQIGIEKRIIIVDFAATGVYLSKDTLPPPAKFREFINPEILWHSEQIETWREGCFSTAQMCGIVPRYKDLIVRAYDRDGNLSTHELTGYTARIFQHELDHLDGIRFPDRIENDNHLHWVEPNDRPEYRVHWAEWKKLFPREKWHAMKKGRVY